MTELVCAVCGYSWIVERGVRDPLCERCRASILVEQEMDAPESLLEARAMAKRFRGIKITATGNYHERHL